MSNNKQCQFEPSTNTSSATICKWCGKEKFQHNTTMSNKQSSIEWLVEELSKQNMFMHLFTKEIQQAKEMENQKDNIIGEIDDELAMLEDYTHGEVGDIITNLRYKIQQYYGK